MRYKQKGKAALKEKDLGVLIALMQRMEKYRLPAARRLKEMVDRGEVLPERDVRFLTQVETDLKRIQPLLDRNPEYQELADNVTNLLNEITLKALENEKNN